MWGIVELKGQSGTGSFPEVISGHCPMIRCALPVILLRQTC
ncbi:hypothetical protein BURKHO8Y_580057 [Burkholderia sp. 8Y]|nr:hypothetical protein BURKHO8Y_580057 [Burkholderia sp. 8Y]